MAVPLLSRVPGWAKPAVVGAVIAVSLVVVLGRLLPSAYSGPTQAVDQYLSAVEHKKFDVAFGLLCTARKPSRSEFDRQISQLAAGSKDKATHKIVGSTSPRRGRATVQFRQITAKGTVDLTAQAVQETNVWKFCGVGAIPPNN